MRGLCSGNFVVWLWFERVHNVGKFDGILDEEYRDVVA